jgi:hypothetical protein
MKSSTDIDSCQESILTDFIHETSRGNHDYLIIKQHEMQRDGVERRRFRRFDMRLMGRFMLEDKSEYTCRIINISAGGAAISSPIQPRIGEQVILYMDHIGRAKGHVGRSEPDHFGVAFDISDIQRERIALKISWLVNQIDGDAPDMRRHHRFVANSKDTQLTLPGDIEITCKVKNFSLSGAGIYTNARPPLGSQIVLGNLQATVIRHTDEGIGVEFNETPSAAHLLSEFGILSEETNKS